MMQSFKGQFSGCYHSSSGELLYSSLGLSSKTDCLSQGHLWQNQFYNYDNIFMGSVTIFRIMFGGHWMGIVEHSLDSNGIDRLQIRDNHHGFWVVYQGIIILGQVMILNLIVGLVLDNFK